MEDSLNLASFWFPPITLIFRKSGQVTLTNKRWLMSLLFLGAGWLAGCSTITTTVETTGVVSGATVSQVMRLTRSRGNVESMGQTRLVAFEGRPEGETHRQVASELKVTFNGSPRDLEERYHYLQVFTEPGNMSGGTSVDRSFAVNRVGSVMHLEQRASPGSQESTRSASSHVGAGWLAVVRDVNRVVPWQIESGTARCVPVNSTDCLDMRFLSKSIFQQVSDGVVRTVLDLPDALGASAIQHELHYVPNVVHADIERRGEERARGFGFIYKVTLQVPLNTFDVYVPINFIWVTDVNGLNALELFIDPIGMGNRAPGPQNLNRILVRSSGPVGWPFEGLIRDKITESMATLELPSFSRNFPLETALDLGFARASGGSPRTTGTPPRYSTTFDFTLLPEGNAVTSSTLLWRRSRTPEIIESGRVRLVFLD
jgi:hypothetical protein